MAIWRAVFPSYAYAHDAASSRKICHGDRLVLSRCSTTSVLALELSRPGRSSSLRERDEGGISRILRVRSASNLAISWSADKVSISMPTPGRTRNRRRASVEPLWLMHASAADNVTPVGAGKPGLARKITRQVNVGRRSADTRRFPPKAFRVCTALLHSPYTFAALHTPCATHRYHVPSASAACLSSSAGTKTKEERVAQLGNHLAAAA